MAMALCNGCSRLGGFLAPFATVGLVASGHTRAAVTLLGGLCSVAALAAFLLPYETRGRDLQATELQLDGSRSLGGARQQPGGSPSDGGASSGSSASLRHVRVHQEQHPRTHTGEELELEPPHEREQDGERGPLLPLPSGPVR